MKRFTSKALRGMFLGALAAGWGCTTGTIGGGATADPATGQPGPGSGTAGAGAGGANSGLGGSNVTGTGGLGGSTPLDPSKPFVAGEAGLRRLTVPQYVNSVRDLLGEVTIPADLDPDTQISGFASVGAARVTLSPHTTEQFETVALDVARQALTNTTRRATLVGCTPAAATDDTCLRAFLTKFGRRAWRRPLAADELTQLVTVTKMAQQTLADFWKGLEYGVAVVLQSPQFLYRSELGAADPANSARVIFDDWELATRLSYFLWNTTPDEELLNAAAARTLSSAAGLTTQVDRLMASPRARSAMNNFFTELLRLDDLSQLPQLPTAFPQVTATLGASMRGETLRGLEELAFAADADFRDLFTARTTFVNAELARLYKVAGPAGADYARVTLPADSRRVGLLGQAGFLAGNAHATSSSPTLRGKFIREVLLCQAIPPPPPNVVTTLPEDTATGPRTMRQRLEIHRKDPGCATCHSVMDPIGLGLENFDGIGAERTMDAGQTIDASGDLDGVPFSGPAELAAALKNHPDVATCLARNLFRYVTGHVESHGEEPAIGAMAQAFTADRHRFRTLVTEMIRSPAFLTAAPSR